MLRTVGPWRSPALPGGILVIEWLALLLAHRYIWSGWLPGDGMVFHVLFYNPVFIGLLLAAVLIPERLLDRWIKRGCRGWKQ